MNKKKITYGLASVGVMASGMVGITAFADGTDVVDEINITVPVSCTMSGSGMTSHNADISNGTSNSAIGETTIKAFCNDNTGFSIYAIGYTDNEDGKNVLTNATLGSTYDITTGTATSGNDSKWAMKLSTIASPAPTYPIIISGSTADTDKVSGDPDYTSFQEVPDDYIKVAYRKSSTDIGTNAEGSTLKTTYQAYISKTQPAGTYSGQVKYTLVHPYDAAAPYKKIYMQDLTSTTIAQLLPNVHDTAKVVDKRDEQEYTIAKLADGKYWMVENLNIAGGTALSSEDTDFDASYTLPTTNGWTVSDGKLVLPASAIKNDADNNLTESTQFGTDNYAYIFNSGNKENCGASGQSTPCYSYYSWDTATLGSGRSISTDNTDAPYSICPKNWKLPTSRYTSTFDATTAARSDFYNLATNYGMSTGAWNQFTSDFYNQAGPNTTPDFLLAGYYYEGFFHHENSSGHYWSSTSYSSSTSSRILFFFLNSIHSSASSGRKYGFSVRCLFGD